MKKRGKDRWTVALISLSFIIGWQVWPRLGENARIGLVIGGATLGLLIWRISYRPPPEAGDPPV